MRKTIIVMGLLTAVIGLMMIFAPEAVVKTAVIILGVAAILNGAYNIIYVRKAIDDKNFSRIIIIRGILGIITGLIAVILPLALAEAVWTAMVYMLAIYLLLSAALEVYGTLKLRSANVNTKMYVAEITVSIVLAFVLFIVPAQVGLILIRIIGIGACIAGIGLIIWERTNRTTVIYAEKIDD